MTPEEKHEIRVEIEKRIAEAEASLDTLREQTKPVAPSVALGRLTRMDAIQQKSMAESNLKTNEALIAKLKKTLVKLDEPDFGVCTLCGKAIPAGRIIAMPEAKTCVQCVSAARGR